MKFDFHVSYTAKLGNFPFPPTFSTTTEKPPEPHPFSKKFFAQNKKNWLFMRSGVLRQENRKQGVQGCLAASSDVVQALKEGQVEGEFFLGNPPVWAQPGAQQ